MLRYLHRATIIGRGTFPFDMLRYDQCDVVPEDVAAFRANVASKASLMPVPPVYIIRIEKTSARKSDAFTVDRWASFGARVVSVDSIRLY